MEKWYRWTVFDRATTAELGGFDHNISATPFVVTRQQLVLEAQPALFAADNAEEPWAWSPLELRSMDLVRGVPVWTSAVRNTDFGGPFPP